MAKNNARRTALLEWLATQPNGKTGATNKMIAATLDVFGADYSGQIRVSEVLRDLEEDGQITVVRTRAHRIHNPSGRIIEIKTW